MAWPTLTVITPSGGRHLYFAAPDGCTIGSFSGQRSPLGHGIDVRGPGRRTGGYLIGPGSVVDGGRYVIELDLTAAPLPNWNEGRPPARLCGCAGPLGTSGADVLAPTLKRATDLGHRWFGVFAVTEVTVDRCAGVRWSRDELGNPVRGVVRPRRDGGCTTGPRVQRRSTVVLRLAGTGLSSTPGHGCVRSH
ncbi:bifunctional DNA primase/polymerase [Streptomyces sp. NPDC051453]|uniref:bifunctional DNA primase/polymerase n=1 Tax=Streptomyces sp. NPDC051453 TaxID=3154941 RepID=UPI0034180119